MYSVKYSIFSENTRTSDRVFSSIFADEPHNFNPMQKYHFLFLSWAFFSAATSLAQTSHADMNLNGEWEYGIARRYDGIAYVPGVPENPDKPAEDRVWYRRQVDLPEGGWNMAVLELKGARFRPEVYIDGDLVSSQEGGMIRSMHELRHENLKAGGSISLEISLASLKDVPSSDASFIPKVDQWRSNCSSSLWDDVVLHLYKDARTDRVLVDSNPAADSVTLRYRVCGKGAATARITVSDGENVLLARTGPADAGENGISFGYHGILKEWSPEEPALYTLGIELVSSDGTVLSIWNQSLGLRKAAVEGKQFVLNGHPLKLRGGTVVWHRWMRDAEGRGVGYDSLWFRDNIVLRLKDHGANLLRFHLGVPPERLLDLCDRYGLAVQFEWSFFHGMPATRESLMEQYPKWFDMAARHPSVLLYHPYNETEGEQLETVWSALNEIVRDYPPVILEDRDVMHIHKYWWSLFENLGLYYDSYDQFPKAIMVDEFGGNYLDGSGNMGGYPSIRESYMRFLGRNHTAEERLHHLDRSCGKVAEYWRRIGAAGVAPFTIASSYADGNHWFLGPLREGRPKNVWNALTVLWSPQAASMEIWDCDFVPGQTVEFPLHFFNDTGKSAELSARVEILDKDGRQMTAGTAGCHVPAYGKQVVPYSIVMPGQCGDYILRTTLLDPPAEVKYPVVSDWDIRVFKAEIPENVSKASVYIPACEGELRKMAEEQELHTVSDSGDADLLLLGRTCWEHLDDYIDIVEKAVERGTGVVMLDIGERYLGQGYPDEKGQLGPLQGVARVTEPCVSHYDLFGGLSITCTEAAEPESHIHPDAVHADLWCNMTGHHTALWNGMRGGLIMPAADFEVSGLSSDAFSAQWSRRNADIGRMKAGNYYAYELCGFFEYDSIPDNRKLVDGLRRKVEFLVEDAPALASSLNPKAPVKVTDLGAGYRASAEGCATELIPLASAGKNLTRTPVVLVGFGPGKGRVLLSGLLTEGRLDKLETAGPDHVSPRYDEAAVQMVLNMMETTLTGVKTADGSGLEAFPSVKNR